MLTLVQQNRSFLLFCVGILLFVSGCSGSQPAADTPQPAPEADIVVHGKVVMLNGSAVPYASVLQRPPIQNVTADENGEFTIRGPVRGLPRDYRFIATHPNKQEFPNLEGIANVRVEKRGIVVTDLVIRMGREDDIKIDLIGLEGRAIPANRDGKVVSGR